MHHAGSCLLLLFFFFKVVLVCFLEFVFLNEVVPRAFNCTLVAPLTREVDNTICSISAQDQS